MMNSSLKMNEATLTKTNWTRRSCKWLISLTSEFRLANLLRAWKTASIEKEHEWLKIRLFLELNEKENSRFESCDNDAASSFHERKKMMKSTNACDDENELKVKEFSWSLSSLMNEDADATVEFNACTFNDFVKVRDEFTTRRFRNTLSVCEEEENRMLRVLRIWAESYDEIKSN